LQKTRIKNIDHNR